MQIQNPEQFRQNIRDAITNKLTPAFLCRISAKHGYGENDIATNIEKSIFNYTIRECNLKNFVKKWTKREFVDLYVDRVRTILNNLQTVAVLNGLESGELRPQQIGFMTHQEFQPDKWKELIDMKIKRDASKCSNKVGASTAMFTCSRCQSKNCTYYEMQTRSADEPATIFITCLNCDKHWRI